MKTTKILRYAAVIFLLSSGTAANANLVTNGSFEDPFVGSAALFTVQPGETTIVGWDVSIASVQLVSDLLWEPSDGDNSIDLDGNAGDAGELSQTFATTAGLQYNVTFDLAGNPAIARPRVKDMRVSADGQSQDFTFDTTNTDTINMGWTPIQWSFVADDTSATLSFLSLSVGDVTGWGATIDNVTVTAVPVPAAVWLFGSALAMLGWKRRKVSA